MEIARDFIREQAGIEDDSTYIMRVLELSNATVTPNETESTEVSPMNRRDLVSPAYAIEPLTGRKVFGVSDTSPGFFDFTPIPEMGAMTKRQSQKRQCDATTECPDGSCCNKQGRCGFGKDNCGDGCQSNCEGSAEHHYDPTDFFPGNAKAFCGKDSEGGNTKCPLNVCCSFYGYCGVSIQSSYRIPPQAKTIYQVETDFCLGAGPSQPCQAGMGSCEVKAAPTCGGASSAGRSVGYYREFAMFLAHLLAWNTDRTKRAGTFETGNAIALRPSRSTLKGSLI